MYLNTLLLSALLFYINVITVIVTCMVPTSTINVALVLKQIKMKGKVSTTSACHQFQKSIYARNFTIMARIFKKGDCN